MSGNLGESMSRDMHQLRETCLTRVETLISELESRCEAQLKTRDQQIEDVKGNDIIRIKSILYLITALHARSLQNLSTVGL